MPDSVTTTPTPNGSTSYDRVAYPSYTHPQTHPDRLAVMGRLFGLQPADVTHCRGLELGCGDGSNVVPMAWALPQSEFVGIDLAGEPVGRGQQMIADLQLNNIKLVHGSVTAIDASWGKFDYIIAHGLFSWVPAEVRDHILRLCRENLAPHGIAFISYNALPGCHLRLMMREMMQYHVRGVTTPSEQVQQAKALMHFLANAEGVVDTDYVLFAKAEMGRIMEHDEGHLFHDDLAEFNEPFYFSQFMAMAAAHGLQYLGEADFPEMSDRVFGDDVRETLGRLSTQRLRREQYLDFLKCRRFRQTLLCHREATPSPSPNWKAVADLYVSSAAERELPTTGGGTGKSAYLTPRGARFQTDFLLGQAALSLLQAAWPRPLRFEELVAGALAKTSGDDPSEAAREALARFLLELYGAAIVDFRTTPSAAVTELSENPVASDLVRWQVSRGPIVSSLFHMAVRVDDEIGRNLLTWIDGTKNRIQLEELLWNFLQKHNASASAADQAAQREKLRLELEENLRKLARFGLLVG